MTIPTISVALPQPVYRKLERAAELTHRPIADILTTVVNATLPDTPELPDALADELAAMHIMNDTALWAAVQPSLSPAEQTRLSQLNELKSTRALTPAEAEEQEQLLFAYHRSVVRRAQALAVLAQRGHPLPSEVDLAPQEL